MGEGVVIDRAPVTADKSADEQQQGRLRLMEIGNEFIDDAEGITGLDHDLRLGMQGRLSGRVQIIENRLQRFFIGYW